MEMMLKMGTKTRKFTVPGDANGDWLMYQSATTLPAVSTIPSTLLLHSAPPFFHSKMGGGSGEDIPTATMPRVPSARMPWQARIATRTPGFIFYTLERTVLSLADRFERRVVESELNLFCDR